MAGIILASYLSLVFAAVFLIIGAIIRWSDLEYETKYFFWISAILFIAGLLLLAFFMSAF